jgi:hypothetical protein
MRKHAGQVVLNRRPIDVVATAASLVQQIEAAVGPRPILLEVTGAALIVDADPLRVEQVLTNLIENAAKYPSSRLSRRWPDGLLMAWCPPRLSRRWPTAGALLPAPSPPRRGGEGRGEGALHRTPP